MRKIAIEEHWGTPAFQQYCFRLPVYRGFRGPSTPGVEAHLADIWNRLNDIDDLRLAEMDEWGIDIQMLSLAPPGIQLEPDVNEAIKMAKHYNDALAKIIARHPKRFAGLAVLPLQDPKCAANELERAVTQLDFKGAYINSHTNGEYLDHEKFWVVFERAEALGVPLYIHPNFLPDSPKVYTGYPELTGPVWGWGVETASHALRLVFSGLFDVFPKTTIILGHLGEMLPYNLRRFDSRWKSFGQQNSKLKKMPSQYFKENFMISTSGNFSPESLILAILTMGADHILFAVDYPYEPNKDGVQFIENAIISDTDREKICHLNAERVFRL